MQKTKRLFAMLMVIAMMLALLPVMASAASSVYIRGSFNSWSGGACTVSGNTATFTIDLVAGTYEFKVVVDNTWYGNNGTITDTTTTTSSTGWDMSTSNGNCKLKASGGTYTFSFNTSTKKLIITHSTAQPIPEHSSPVVNADAVTFYYWNPNATSVVVAGNMNSWSTTANPMTQREDGLWTTTISGLLDDTTYQYKFVVGTDGWTHDPKNTNAKIDDNNTFTITDGIVPTEPTRNVIVHYRNTQAWDGTLNAYAWDYESSVFYTAGFPGDEMDLETEHANWYTVSVALPVSATGMSIQFSSGSNKGDVLSISDIPTDADSEYWYDDLTDAQFLTAAPESWADGSVEIPECPEIVYLLPNFNWGGANYAAYFFSDTENQWVSMTDANADGVYEAAVPEGMTSVIFCRTNPDFADLGWNTETETRIWNQSDDIAIPTDGTDLFIMNQGVWGKDTENPWAGAWSTYTEVTVPEITSPVVSNNSVTFNYWHYAASSVSVHGSMDGWVEGYAMTKGENGAWSVTINDLPNGVYTYKLVVDDCWITDPNNANIQTEADGNQNSMFTIGEPVAEIYNVGTFYTLEEAYAAADPVRGDSISLLADISVNDLVIDKEMYLDLNGHNATINAASATAMILVQDSATVDPEATEWGTLIVNGADCAALGGYVMLPEAEGHSFHSYEIQITHISLAPNSDALGFKAQLIGDSAVMNAVTGFGFYMSVAGGTEVEFVKNEPLTDGTFTLRLKNILASGGGEMEISASAFVIFGEDQSWSSDEQTTTMKDTLKAVDSAWETAGYTTEQKDAVKALCDKFYDIVQQWNLDNIFATIDIPITQ